MLDIILLECKRCSSPVIEDRKVVEQHPEDVPLSITRYLSEKEMEPLHLCLARLKNEISMSTLEEPTSTKVEKSKKTKDVAPSGNLFEIEEILSHRHEENVSTLEFLIKWKDYSPRHNSWINESDLWGTVPLEQYINRISLKRKK
jgi:hypothetical protein